MDPNLPSGSNPPSASSAYPNSSECVGPDDAIMAQLVKKIDRERVLISAANSMRQSTTNPAVLSRLNTQIRDGRRNIEYLEGRMRELQMNRLAQGMHSMTFIASQSTSHHPVMPANSAAGHDIAAAPASVSSYPPTSQPSFYTQNLNSSHTSTAFTASSHEFLPATQSIKSQSSHISHPELSNQPPPPPPHLHHPYAPTTLISDVSNDPSRSHTSPAPRPTYTKLDLIKYDTPYLGPRIQHMLSQLAFKLSVEKQYKDGLEKMLKLYKADGDRRSKADAETRRIESNQKIQLLKQALRRYEDLHIDIEGVYSADNEDLNVPSARKPLTGFLSIKIHAVADVDHAAIGRFSRGPETFVVIKVEDVPKARTKATRNDRWSDEHHDFHIDKANEIELTVYDRSSDHPLPIGLLWIRISDIAEELRRRKIEAEFINSGWVSADQMNETTPSASGSTGFNTSTTATSCTTSAAASATSGVNAGAGSLPSAPISISSWFSLEPVGRIHLTLTFVKTVKDRRPVDIGLNRKGAIRQRKGQVVEQYGHKFIQQQFYNIMRCALCGDFLKYAAGMQCSDCKYTCHKKCYPKVVTKCITQSSADTDPDEAKINYRIPHRFEPFANMGANWCCHCGYILSLGRKQCRRCTECGLSCHLQCQHFVPDFCGMSAEMANQILGEIRKHKPQRQSHSHGKSQSVSTSKLSSLSQESVSRPPSTTNVGGEILGELSQIKGSSVSLDHPYSYSKEDREAGQSSSGTQSAVARPHSDTGFGNVGADSAPQAQSTYAYKHSKERNLGVESGWPQPGQSIEHSKSSGYHSKEYVAGPQGVRGSSVTEHVGGGWAESGGQRAPVPPRHGGDGRKSDRGLTTTVPTTTTAVTVEGSLRSEARGSTGGGKRIGLDHFNFLAVLGKGNFGKVMLAETKTTKQLYAIKVLKKEFIIENDEVESIKSEKRVFLIANKERHPFLLNLHACFQTETRVYFVMEYISGGDLMLHIQRGQFGTKRAQFYAAEVCLALKYFHENGVIYRDLKLDNILLTLDGHIKIADYGLCKENMWYGSKTSTFCGTPEFMAPEILLDKKYGRAVDWWAFGVLIYQMLLQQSPFRGEDEDEIYDAILADEPLYPIHMPRDSVSILQQLLTREPELRMGSGPADAGEIMSHAFFRNINWDDIYHRRIPAPFIPRISSPTDTSNFDTEFTSVTPVLTPVQSVLTPAMQEEFRGFSYSADLE